MNLTEELQGVEKKISLIEKQIDKMETEGRYDDPHYDELQHELADLEMEADGLMDEIDRG